MISEYDAFGPWVYEIDEVHPLPKLFVPYIHPDPDRTIMVKVPRQIDRQDAEPGMDLYDYIIAVSKNNLTIYGRTEGSQVVRVISVKYEDVVAVTIKNVLLSSEVTIMLLSGETIVVPFNRISFDVMQKVILAIRNNAAKHPVEFPDPVDKITVDQLQDTTFVNMFNEFSAQAQNARIGMHQNYILMPPVYIPASVCYYSTDELEVVEKPVDYDPTTNKYGYKITYVALQNLTDIEVVESRKYDRLYNVIFNLRGGKQNFSINVSTVDTVAFFKEVFSATHSKQSR